MYYTRSNLSPVIWESSHSQTGGLCGAFQAVALSSTAAVGYAELPLPYCIHDLHALCVFHVFHWPALRLVKC